MGSLSPAEREMIASLGFEALRFLLNVYKTSKAQGVDLIALLDKASDLNDLDIDEI